MRAAKLIALMTLDEAVAFIAANDDLEVPEGHAPVTYLSGVISVVVVAAIYDVLPQRVARLALCKLNRR